MAKGLLGFLGFGKREKPNLTPDVGVMPFGASAYSAPLKDFALKRLKGEDVGFGDDFVNKATNPVANRMRQDFKDYTSPFLSSQASARGLGRSTIALDQQRRAGGEVQSDIDQLMSKFYTLNEAQKKADITEGVNLSTQQQGAEFAQSNEGARASERLRDLTVGQANARNARADQMQDRTMQVLGSTIGAVTGGIGMGGVGGAGSLMSGGGISTGINAPGIGPTSTYGPNNVPRGFEGLFSGAQKPNGVWDLVQKAIGGASGGVKANVLGGDDDLFLELMKRGLI